ncbi:AAA family ATPase [Staphylococcus shinii]|uniref:ATP-dependent nuclease n=1 Tax=Staphylococcus shinii TaxID=2912228 RepID=UPI00398B416D
MKISDVYIENFRSISEAKLNLSNYSVVFGKNNEGKSNIMKAIYRAWNIIGDFSTYSYTSIRLRHKKNGFRIKYNGTAFSNTNKEIEDDITIDSKNKSKIITIGLYFNLTSEEKVKLNRLMKSKTKITDKIYVEVKYDESLFYNCKIKLNINGRFLMSPENIHASVAFIIENFGIDYIPSIRTEETATEIVQNAVKERLKDLRFREEYNEAISLVNELQDQELKKLSSQIEPDLKRYLKNITSIEVVSLRNDRPVINYGYSRDIDIHIDDGRLTSIKNKGDGIKSLIALSILQTSESSNRLLMIDEPEAHLHSGAIRELKSKIKNDTLNHQTLICSHHQIFVDRNQITNNKILNKGRIQENTNIRKIRSELGVSLSENLLSSELVLLVEGDTDKYIVEEFISKNNPKLKSYIDDGRFFIDSIQGVRNLSTRVSIYEAGLCKIICLLDNDDATKDINKEESGSETEYFYIPRLDKKEAEIEDIFEEDFIFKVVEKVFGIKEAIKRKGIIGDFKFTKGLKKLIDSYRGKTLEKADENMFKWAVVKELQDQETLPIKKEYKIFLKDIFEEIEKLIEG